jgi:hypothetical protein
VPRVYDKTGKLLIEVEDELLRDFFDEIFIEDKSLVNTLIDYNLEARDKISLYIIWRLAEVDPGFLPSIEYGSDLA